MNEINLFVDGSVKKASQADSRGRGAYRFLATSLNNVLLHDQSFREDNQTVPETEIKALIKGLEWFDSCPYCKHDSLLHVLCDSELVVKWISGEYKMRAENIVPLYLKAKSLIDKLERKQVVVKMEKISGKSNLAHIEA